MKYTLPEDPAGLFHEFGHHLQELNIAQASLVLAPAKLQMP